MVVVLCYDRQSVSQSLLVLSKLFVACIPGNVTNNLWVLDLALDLLGIHQAELRLIVALLILL
jgi:hypothetical protein